MSNNLINSVIQLIQLGKGDPGRLEYILEMLNAGRELPSSDQKYLDNLIPLYLEHEPMPEYTDQPEISITRKIEYIDQFQKDIQNLNQRLSKLEKHGFEKYVGKKAIFFFATVFVGWNALQVYSMMFLNLPAGLTQYFFPLNLIENYTNYPMVQFVFTAMMYAWVFIGFVYLSRYIKSRKISSQY